MHFRSLPLGLFLLVVVMSFPTIAAAKNSGTFKVGAVLEYRDTYDATNQDDAYGTPVGILLGYEEDYGEYWWWGVDASYKYGEMDGVITYDSARFRAQGVLGAHYDYAGIEFRPFIGLGIDWEALDAKTEKDAYVTDYLVPIGVSAQKQLSSGVYGADLTFEYVLRRDLELTQGSGTWGSRTFDGSYNAELGVFFEPEVMPVGFRPYYRYEYLQESKYWTTMDRNAVGLEVYMKF